MNILQVLPRLDEGGVETGTVDLARYLAANGHKAVVISEGGRLVDRLHEVGARHYKLPVGRKSIFALIGVVPRIVDVIRKENMRLVALNMMILPVFLVVAIILQVSSNPVLGVYFLWTAILTGWTPRIQMETTPTLFLRTIGCWILNVWASRCRRVGIIKICKNRGDRNPISFQ